jgi:hypothetical protein
VIDHVTGAHPINQFDRPRARLVGLWRPNGPSRQSKVGERGCHLVQAAAPPPCCTGLVRGGWERFTRASVEGKLQQQLLAKPWTGGLRIAQSSNCLSKP